jgi:hypothetical protein
MVRSHPAKDGRLLSILMHLVTYVFISTGISDSLVSWTDYQASCSGCADQKIFDLNRGQQCYITKSIREQSKKSLFQTYSFFFLPTFLSLQVLFSDSLVSAQSSRKAKSPTTVSTVYRTNVCLFVVETHLPPRFRSSMGQPTCCCVVSALTTSSSTPIHLA